MVGGMKTWDISTLEFDGRTPQVLASGDDARAIALELRAGEALTDHQVHERAWVIVVAGEVQITTAAGERVEGLVGRLVEFAPGERHALHARTDARILLLLTPWPGAGHPGAMAVGDKAQVRERAAEHEPPTG